MRTVFYVTATKGDETIVKYFATHTQARAYANELEQQNYEVHLKRTSRY